MTVAKSGFPGTFSGKCPQAVGKAKGMYKDGVSLLKFLGSASLVSRYVGNLNPVPQVQAPGQLNRPFSQEDWDCVLFCCP